MARPLRRQVHWLPRRRTTAIEIAFAVGIGLAWTFLTVSLWGVAFWASNVGWAFMGFLMLPLRVAIPKRRGAKGPLVGFGAWLATLGSLYLLTRVTGGNGSPIMPIAGAAGGICFGMAANLAVLTIRLQKTGYCENCHAMRGLAKDRGVWYCDVCGTEFRNGSLVRARKVPKTVRAWKVPKGPGTDGSTNDLENVRR